MQDNQRYGEEQIEVLEGLEPVRKRPEMYIGSTEKKGLHHLVWEIVDNSVDEYMAGFCNKIEVTIHKDNSISVSDNGRGIPVGIHQTKNKPTLEVVLTVLHAGGKFGSDGSPYKSSGGLHGVGSACVNALSENMVATVKRNGKIYRMSFSKGIPSSPLESIGECDPNDSGTTIWFKPDPEIFKETQEYDFQIIHNRLRESSFLNGGLDISLIDERVDTPHTVNFYFENGIKDFIKLLNKNKKPITEEIFHFSETHENVYVEAAFQFTHSYEEYTASFANNIKTIEGGTHETGYKSSLTNVFKQIIDSRELIKNDQEALNGEDVRKGLVSVVSVKVNDPKFEGQTKNKLVNTEVRAIVQKIVQDQISNYLSENPKLIKPVLDKILSSYEERISIKKARETIRKQNKRAQSTFTLPEKLADCSQSTPASEREIFIVEGDSAGGSAKGARNKSFQAVLPLRGKVLNVEKATLEKILKNNEIHMITNAIGAGLGEQFDVNKTRYGKVIIMTDADVDGAHIEILLLTFFYRYMRPLIEKGLLYLARPPLYGLKRKNKILEFVSTEEELEIAKSKHPNSFVQRYKGLGEMNNTELEETTMNPENRKLLRVDIEDAHLAGELIESLMGESPIDRKRFIEENSHKADVDI